MGVRSEGRCPRPLPPSPIPTMCILMPRRARAVGEGACIRVIRPHVLTLAVVVCLLGARTRVATLEPSTHSSAVARGTMIKTLSPTAPCLYFCDAITYVLCVGAMPALFAVGFAPVRFECEGASVQQCRFSRSADEERLETHSAGVRLVSFRHRAVCLELRRRVVLGLPNPFSRPPPGPGRRNVAQVLPCERACV